MTEKFSNAWTRYSGSKHEASHSSRRQSEPLEEIWKVTFFSGRFLPWLTGIIQISVFLQRCLRHLSLCGVVLRETDVSEEGIALIFSVGARQTCRSRQETEPNKCHNREDSITEILG